MVNTWWFFWLDSCIIMNKNATMGMIANIKTGIIGAFIGGIVYNFFGHQKVTGLNFHSVIVSVIGACILLWIIGAVNKK